MQQFIEHHSSMILGTLSGFDRMRFRGTQRLLANVRGMAHFLHQIKVQLKEFGTYVDSATAKIRAAVTKSTERAGQTVQYVDSARVSKEELVQGILQQKEIKQGLVCVLSCVEPCQTYEIHRDRERKMIDLAARRRKCLHYYHDYLDPLFGLVHVRTQTWFPFNVHICMNGREWLARQMDAAKIGYVRRDNSFLQIDDFARAQKLMDRQLRTDWPKHLGRLARQANPVLEDILREFPTPLPYYWSLEESEWATDVVFPSAKDLDHLYSKLIQHGMQNFGSQDVMRFLGRKTPATPGRYGRFQGQITTDLRSRPEGVRIKHRINSNSIKMYNKFGSVLRVETTINDPRDMKVYRPKEGEPDGPKQWRRLRKGVADVHRRAELSQKANTRYLDALATVEDTTPLGELLKQLCRHTSWNGKRVRAMNPFGQDDGRLLEAISRGEFLLNGFRNRDLRPLLYGDKQVSDKARRSQSAAVTRQIRMLRAHHLIRKVPKSHRYQLTERGRTLVTAILAAKNATISQLTPAA